MPARGAGRPTGPRGVTCPGGHDEWRTSGSGRHTCAVCDRERCRDRQRHIRKARPALRMWQRAQMRANDTLVPFLLTEEDVRAAWPVDGKCPALGFTLEVGTGVANDASPTLDRLSGDSGYEPGNIAIISLRANRAKGNLQACELEAIARWMRAQGLD